MSQRSSSMASAFCAICCIASIVQLSHAADFVVSNRTQVLELTSKIQATQFLTHATFGPTEAEVNQLATEMRSLGTIAAASAWIDRQTNETLTPPVLHLPKIYDMLGTDYPLLQNLTVLVNGTYAPTGNPPNSSNVPNPTRYRQYAWWDNAIRGQDQLRQKTAWALAQICAVGNPTIFNATNLDSTVTNGPVNQSRHLGITNFYDIFVKNAFGTYRRVIGEVTYHPIMGDWLTFRGNRRAAPGIAPDENYAREVMQLFTIGLDLLNDSGEQQLNASGVIPTYDADDIREYAQIFTGLGYGYGTLNTTSTAYSPYTGAAGGLNANVKYGVPMRMAPAEHDRSSKWLLSGRLNSVTGGNSTIDEGINSATSHTEASANAEIDAALDGLVNHQSCAPFIVNRLIMRFVKSNPSKAYMNRVVQVFKNNGSGVRGDLKAVVKAILLDPEAWQPIRVQYQRSPSNKIVVSTMGTEDSRLQEPVLNYTRFMRYFKSVARYEKSNDGSATYASPATVLTNEFRLGSQLANFNQSPYETPTVFNFYTADYQPNQLVNIPVSSRIPNGVVGAAEFEILNAVTAPRTNNLHRTNITAGTRNEGQLSFNTAFNSNQGNIRTTPSASTRTIVTYNFTTERDLCTSAAGIDSLLERLDLHMCGGTLSNAYKSRLRTALIAEITAAGATVDATEALNIAKGAILAIMTAPSFLVTE